MVMDEYFPDSFLLQASDLAPGEAEKAINIVDMLLEESQPEVKPETYPNVLSQIIDENQQVCAGQIETEDGKLIPITIGDTDIGNGKPRPYITISDSPSILARHVTITAVQTNDGKFRAMLRVNHAHGRVLLGGSVIRAETMYPITDEDEIVLGDGVKFKLRLNNRVSRLSVGGPTQYYMAAPNSEEAHASEQREMEEKRRNFQDRMTPPVDDSILLELVASGDALDGQEQNHVSLVHQMGDTYPYSSSAGSPMEEEVRMVVSIPPVEEKISEEIHEEELENAESQTSPDNFLLDEEVVNETLQEEIVNESFEAEERNDDESRENGVEGSQMVLAPQLSQENTSSPDEDLKTSKRKKNVKREISDVNSFNTVNKRIKIEETQDGGVMTRRSSSRGSSVSGVSPPSSLKFANGGPKKLVLLKTAVDIDKATESSLSSIGLRFESKFSDKVDGLITGSIVRTTKFLCAINKGLAIFPKSILNEIRINRSLPPTDQSELWLQDPEGETKYGFSLADSIRSARACRLLHNFDVFCFKNGMGEFSPDEFKDLVISAGGKLINRLPKQIPDSESLVVIGSESNFSSAKSSGLKFFNKIEFLVDACIKQKLDFSFARVDLM